MAKYVYLTRHAKAQWEPGYDIWQYNIELAEEALDQIDRAVRYFTALGVVFAAFYHSRPLRARQTCTFFAGNMTPDEQDIPMGHTNSFLGPRDPNEWNFQYNKWRRSKPDPDQVYNLTHLDCLSLWPELCKKDGERVFRAVQEIAASIKDGESAAAFSHVPLIRLAEYAATGSCEGPEISYCQAICFVFEDDKFLRCEDHLL